MSSSSNGLKSFALVLDFFSCPKESCAFGVLAPSVLLINQPVKETECTSSPFAFGYLFPRKFAPTFTLSPSEILSNFSTASFKNSIANSCGYCYAVFTTTILFWKPPLNVSIGFSLTTFPVISIVYLILINITQFFN